MKRNVLFVFFAILNAFLLCGPSVAVAGEKVLEFMLVTKAIDVRPIEIANVENQTVGQGHFFGVATFKDGRIAVKDFVFDFDYNKGAGPFYGYSTYTFGDGSSITARFSGETKPNQVQHGEYRILSGTGGYAGATGTGTFDRIQSSFKGVGLFNVKLVIVTP